MEWRSIILRAQSRVLDVSKTDTRWSWTIHETVTQQLSGPPTLKRDPTSDALIAL